MINTPNNTNSSAKPLSGTVTGNGLFVKKPSVIKRKLSLKEKEQERQKWLAGKYSLDIYKSGENAVSPVEFVGSRTKPSRKEDSFKSIQENPTVIKIIPSLQLNIEKKLQRISGETFDLCYTAKDAVDLFKVHEEKSEKSKDKNISSTENSTKECNGAATINSFTNVEEWDTVKLSQLEMKKNYESCIKSLCSNICHVIDQSKSNYNRVCLTKAIYRIDEKDIPFFGDMKDYYECYQNSWENKFDNISYEEWLHPRKIDLQKILDYSIDLRNMDYSKIVNVVKTFGIRSRISPKIPERKKSQLKFDLERENNMHDAKKYLKKDAKSLDNNNNNNSINNINNTSKNTTSNGSNNKTVTKTTMITNEITVPNCSSIIINSTSPINPTSTTTATISSLSPLTVSPPLLLSPPLLVSPPLLLSPPLQKNLNLNESVNANPVNDAMVIEKNDKEKLSNSEERKKNSKEETNNSKENSKKETNNTSSVDNVNVFKHKKDDDKEEEEILPPKKLIKTNDSSQNSKNNTDNNNNNRENDNNGENNNNSEANCSENDNITYCRIPNQTKNFSEFSKVLTLYAKERGYKGSPFVLGPNIPILQSDGLFNIDPRIIPLFCWNSGMVENWIENNGDEHGLVVKSIVDVALDKKNEIIRITIKWENSNETKNLIHSRRVFVAQHIKDLVDKWLSKRIECFKK